MLNLQNQITHHKGQLAKWKATSQRSFGVNDGWFNRATRQVKFHTAKLSELRAKAFVARLAPIRKDWENGLFN